MSSYLNTSLLIYGESVINKKRCIIHHVSANRFTGDRNNISLKPLSWHKNIAYILPTFKIYNSGNYKTGSLIISLFTLILRSVHSSE